MELWLFLSFSSSGHSQGVIVHTALPLQWWQPKQISRRICLKVELHAETWSRKQQKWRNCERGAGIPDALLWTVYMNIYRSRHNSQLKEKLALQVCCGHCQCKKCCLWTQAVHWERLLLTMFTQCSQWVQAKIPHYLTMIWHTFPVVTYKKIPQKVWVNIISISRRKYLPKCLMAFRTKIGYRSCVWQGLDQRYMDRLWKTWEEGLRIWDEKGFCKELIVRNSGVGTGWQNKEPEYSRLGET